MGDIAERWGQLADAAKKSANTLAVVDGIIAATAPRCWVVTITKHFVDLGLTLVHP